MSETIAVVLGLSTDKRTHRWRVTCPKCGKQFEPKTTLLSTQHIECPKCGAEMIAYYNSEPPVVKLMQADGETE